MATFEEIRTSDSDAPRDGDGLAPGVRPTLVGAIGVAVMVALPYFVGPAWFGDELGTDLQIWVEGDRTPFTHLFRTDGVGPVVAEAGGKAASAEPELVEAVKAAEAAPETFDIAVVAPPPAEAVAVAEADAAGNMAPPGDGEAAAPGPVAEPNPPPRPRLSIPAAAWEGIDTFVEDPKGAMGPFYAALERTALKQDKAVTRIAHWGDSAIAADGMTSAARRFLQAQFGDAGHGWILVEPGTDWYKHKNVRYGHGGWKAMKIIDKGARDGHYGYGGVSSRGYLGARAWFATAEDDSPVGKAVSRFEVYYLKQPKGGWFTTQVDDTGEPVRVETAADELTDAVHVVEVPDGPHRLDIRAKGGGPVRLYGVVLERDGPGVVYDSMGLVGARGSRLLNADPAHWKRQLDLRKPDLMIIMYGGNELADRGMNMEKYGARFRQVLRRFRDSRPEAACLVMSPLDHGVRKRGRVVTDEMLLEMMPVQRESAFAEGCAWYSVFDAMGGEGSMGRWNKSEPRLGWGDLAHVTKAGAKVLGERFYKALLKGLGEWSQAQVEATP